MPPSLPISRPLSSIRHATTTLGAAPRALLSTSARLCYRQNAVPNSGLPIPSPTAQAPYIPEYPYGPRQVYKQSNTGLYGAQRIRFGNNVSEDHKVKTRRKWRVNVQRKRLWSDALATFVRTRVTTRVLRTIDKDGGLDNYLLGTKPARVKDLGPWGWRLRWRLMQAPAVQALLNAERERLGLPPKVYGLEQNAVVAAAAATAAGADGPLIRHEMTDEYPIELQAEGLTAAEALQQTNEMLEREEEFALGEEAEEEARKERGFMHEEKPKQ